MDQNLENKVNDFDFVSDNNLAALAAADYYSLRNRVKLSMEKPLSDYLLILSCQGHWSNGNVGHLRGGMEYLISAHTSKRKRLGKKILPNLPNGVRKLINHKTPQGELNKAFRNSFAHRNYQQVSARDLILILNDYGLINEGPDEILTYISDRISEAGDFIKKALDYVDKDNYQLWLTDNGQQDGKPLFGIPEFAKYAITDVKSFLRRFGFATGVMDDVGHRTRMAKHYKLDKMPGGGLCVAVDREMLRATQVFGKHWTEQELALFDVESYLNHNRIRDRVTEKLGIHDLSNIDRETGLRIFEEVVVPEFMTAGVIKDQKCRFSHNLVPMYIRAYKGPGTSDFMTNFLSYAIDGIDGLFGSMVGDIIDTLEKISADLYVGGRDSSMFESWRKDHRFREVVDSALTDGYIFPQLLYIYEGMEKYGNEFDISAYEIDEIVSASVRRMVERVYRNETPISILIKFGADYPDYMSGRSAELPDVNFSYEKINLKKMLLFMGSSLEFLVKKDEFNGRPLFPKHIKERIHRNLNEGGLTAYAGTFVQHDDEDDIALCIDTFGHFYDYKPLTNFIFPSNYKETGEPKGECDIIFPIKTVKIRQPNKKKVRRTLVDVIEVKRSEIALIRDKQGYNKALDDQLPGAREYLPDEGYQINNTYVFIAETGNLYLAYPDGKYKKVDEPA